MIKIDMYNIITIYGDGRECSFGINSTEKGYLERCIKNALKTLPKAEIVIYWNKKIMDKIENFTVENIKKNIKK